MNSETLHVISADHGRTELRDGDKPVGDLTGHTQVSSAIIDLLLEARKLRDALKGATELLSNSDVRFMICDGGRGHLGEQALYHRVINQAKAAIKL